MSMETATNKRQNLRICQEVTQMSIVPATNQGQNMSPNQEITLDEEISHSFEWIRYTKLILTSAGLYYKPLRWSSIGSFIYPFFLLVMSAVISCYQIFVHKANDALTLTMFKVQSNTYVIGLLIIQILFMFRITPRMRLFSEKYKDLKRKYSLSFRTPKEIKLLSLKKIITVSFVSLLVIPVSLELFALVEGSIVNVWFHHYFTSDDPFVINVTFVLISIVCAVYRWIFACALVTFFIHCYIIGNDFTILIEDLETFLEDDSTENEKAEKTMRHFRSHFLSLSELTNEIDTIVGPISLMFLLFGVIFLVLHVMSLFDFSQYKASGDYFRILTCISVIVTINKMGYFVYASLILNSKATAIKPVLLSANIDNCSPQFFREVTMLLHKVNHDHIGLTACGLFNLNKSFIVSLVTISVSYAIILFRFGLMFEPDKGLSDSIVNLVNETQNSVTSRYCKCADMTTLTA